MAASSVRRWWAGLRARPGTYVRPRRLTRARLAVHLLEGREVPSTTIPLNGVTWTDVGPRPILSGEAPGRPDATGRFDSITVDPGDPNTLFAASAVGGIWRSQDGGSTWSPRTDLFVPPVAPSTTSARPVNSATLIRMVNRSPADTIYAVSASGAAGFFYLSTDGGNTFNRMDLGAVQPFSNRRITKFIVIPDPTDPNNQAKDLIYASVRSIDGGTSPAGIYRSVNGGQNWVNITAAGFPFNPAALIFSDVDVDPNNKEVVYATVDAGASAGVYRITNAFTTNGTATPAAQTPNWAFRLGGGAEFSGFLPTHIQTEVSPSLSSVIFAAVSSGNQFIALYRSTDTGINWTPLLSTGFVPTGTVPDISTATLGAISQGDVYLQLMVDPRSPANPTRQTVYLGSYGDPDYNFVVSRDSGDNWKHNANDGLPGDPLDTYARGANGVGPYVGIRDLQLDLQVDTKTGQQTRRVLVATEGGIYRMNDQFIDPSLLPPGGPVTNPPPRPINWVSINGVGAGALNSVQIVRLGQGLSPNTSNQMIINASPFHSAVRFQDTKFTANWKTTDDQGLPFHEWVPPPIFPSFSPTWGTGPVIYDFNQPNIVYRVSLGSIRRSDDFGVNWRDIPLAYPANSAAFAIDPSDSRLMFSGSDDIYVYQSTNDATDSLFNITGLKLPSLDFDGFPGTVTAIGISRQDKRLYVATTPGIYTWQIPVPPPDPPPPAPPATTRMYVLDFSGNLAPDWVELTLPLEVSGSLTNPALVPPDRIQQIIVDPNNQNTVYFTTQNGGGVYRQQAVLAAVPGPTPPAPPPPQPQPPPPSFSATAVWQRLNPSGAGNIRPQDVSGFNNATGANVIALDPNVGTNPNDDILYLGTNNGVFELPINPTQTKGFTWTPTGVDTTTLNSARLPNNAVRDLDINTTTGVMSAALNGRGVWQFQIRTLVTGRLFNDVDGDANFDVGLEPGLSNFVVALRDVNSNSVVATTTTDGDGFYEFVSVPAGTYTVTTQGLTPAGWVITTAAVPNFTVTLRDSVYPGPVAPGFISRPELNIGNFRLGSISGIKFDDANQNRTQDTGEVGLPGFTIYVDANNNQIFDTGEPSALTDGSGKYSFTNLGPPILGGLADPNYKGLAGQPLPTYVLREQPLAGWIQTFPDPAVNGGAQVVPLISGANPNGVNFGNFQPGTIRGRAFLDINSNANFESGEPGLSGWTVFIDANLNSVFDSGETSVLTDANGFFSFANLAPGTYVIRQVLQTGFVRTTPNPAPITLTGTNSVTGVLFGNAKPSTNRWDPVGPAPQLDGQGIGNPSVSGRVNDISVAKGAGIGGLDRYYIATDGGGVWRSLDAGQNWRPLTDNLPNLSVFESTSNFSSVAVAPSNANVVYAGGGHGILKTVDGGDTWTLFQGPDTIFGIPAFEASTISRIVVDTFNENLVFAAVSGFFDSGIFVSTDGGNSWTDTTAFDPLFSGVESWTDVQVDPNNPNVVFGAVGNDGGSVGNGIYRTTNALSVAPDYTLMIGGSGFLPGSLPGNIKLAIAPSQPSTLYAALAEATDPFTGDSIYLGTYKSTDGGVNWIRLINAPDFMGTQGNYNVAITVNPTNPNVVYAGGLGVGPEFSVNLVISTNDGGTSWKSAIIGGGANATVGPHVDIHGMAFDSSNRLLVGSDGGMFRLNNALLPAPNFAPPFGGVVPNWVSLNGSPGNPNSLNTIQFVGIATHPTSSKRAIGGSQDNGIAQFLGSPAWVTRLGGDGGETVWDFDQPNNIYRIAPIKSVGANGYIAKSTDGGVTWVDSTNGITGQTFQNTLFYPPLIMDPGNSRRLFTGTDAVWVTDDGGVNWTQETKFSSAVNTPIPTTPFSGQTPPNPIYSLAIGRSGAQFLYVAQAGRLLRIELHSPFPTPPSTEEWIDVTPPGSSMAASANASRILVDPTNPNVLYVLAGGGSGTVWRSTFRGDPGTWTPLDGAGIGALPGLGNTALALDTRGSTSPTDDILYIGNSNGVWQMTNPTTASPIWERTGGATLPVALVNDLDLNATTGLLSAGTYGRGLWHTRIRGQISGQVFTDKNGNGNFDFGEFGRAGVTVRLLDATPGGSFGAELATTVTDGNGFYAFSSLRAGNYMVEQALPANGVQTTAKPPAFFNVTEQSDIVPVFAGNPPPSGVVVEPLLNMGFFQLGSVSGVKFDDVNQNQVRDQGEFALPGFTIYVDRNNNNFLDPGEQFLDLNGNSILDPGEPLTAVVTDSNGAYTLTGIFPPVLLGLPGPMPTPYRLREVQQAGWIQTTPAQILVTPVSGLTLVNVNFGNFRPGSIRGRVFFDLNNDAVQQSGEPGQPNWRVYLDADRDNVFDPGEVSVLTDSAGFFSFSNLPPGTYVVRQELQPGFAQTTANPPDAVLTGTNSIGGISFGLFQVSNPWVEIGPRPIVNGQSPGQPPATGRFDEVAIVRSQISGAPDVYYAVSQDGGIWRSKTAGQFWTVRSDRLPFTRANEVAAFARPGGDTVYVATITGVYKSTNGANDFALLGTADLNGGVVNAMAVVPSATAPNDPNQDILYITVMQRNEVFGEGVFRSTDGGQSWTRISANIPFGEFFLTFTDIDIEPGNPDVVYVSTGNAAGSPTNGIYRIDNALTAGPGVPGQWTLRIGGSAFFPGTTPGTIELTIAPNAPSVLFASVAERIAPLSGWSRLLGIFRSTDAGVNWTGLFNPDVVPTGNVPNYLGIDGDFANTIVVDPASGIDPTQQILYAAGYGDSANDVIMSRDSGNTWQDISAGANGVGPYVGVHGANFDTAGKLVLSTQGGVYRLNSITPNISWQSLNGNPGIGSLNSLSIPIGGYGSHPTDPYRGIANGGIYHTAVQYSNRLPAGYGWRTVDATTSAPFHTRQANVSLGREGSGTVFYNFNDPNTIYRVTPAYGNQDREWLRRSNDGGLTWQGIANGIPGQFAGVYPAYPALIDPSNSEHIFVGTDQVSVSNDGGNTWGTILRTSVSSTTPIPTLPTSGKNPVIPISALGVGRTTGNVAPRLYAATVAGDLYTITLPDAAPPANPASTDDWINLAPILGFGDFVTQMIIDPNDETNIYALTASGIVQNFTGTGWVILNDENNGTSPDELGSPGANVIALDPRVAADPTDDILYVGTSSGVYKLTNPGATFNSGPYFWQEVGTGLPNLPITALDLNTTTGILTAGTFGRGVWQVQLRALISGIKFDDTNGNGTQEAGEPPVQGVVIQIVDANTNAVVATTTTDAQGFYEFRSLRAGRYIVREITPAGSIQVSPAIPVLTLAETDSAVHTFVGQLPVPLTTQVVSSLAIGNYRLATISGVKFEDRNADGTKQGNEPGLPGFRIFIDVNTNGLLDWADGNGNGVWDLGEGERWAASAADGTYSFTGLTPGSYVIREVQQLGFNQTSINPTAIVPTSGQVVSNVNFGNIRIARLFGAIFDDTNGNGLRDGNETGIGGFTVQLVDLATGLVVRTVQSDPDGSYAFRSLLPGNYLVRQSLPSGWIQTFPVSPTGVPLTYSRTVGPTDQIGNLDFGNFRLFTVSGIKFEDLNGDGVRQNGEPGVAGFTFVVRNLTTGTSASAISDTAGNYAIPNLGPGTYEITESPRAGWTQTTPTPPQFPGTSGGNLTNVNFGNFKLITVGGTVFGDVNLNGVRDAGEPGLGGFLILLDRNNDGVIDQSTVSDGAGNYLLRDVGPGVYTLRQQPRRGWQLTSPASGAYVFAAVSSQNVNFRDFGNVNRGIYAVGQDAGGGPLVSVRTIGTNQQVASFNAYSPAFRGGVRVATGYLNGTSNAQVITAAGPGGGPHVRVFNPLTGEEVFGFMAYAPTFTRGVYVAAGDFDGDGFDDIVTAAGEGGGPHVRVISGRTRAELAGWFAYDSRFTVGVRVATGDLDGDGRVEVITSPGPGGGPHVRAFTFAGNGAVQVVKEFMAYDVRFTGGVYVTAGDLNGDGKADIVTGAGAGGGPHVRAFSGVNLGELAGLFPYESNYRGGVRVFAVDQDFDNRADLIVGPGTSRQPTVRTYKLNGTSFSQLASFNAFDPAFLGGVYVG